MASLPPEEENSKSSVVIVQEGAENVVGLELPAPDLSPELMEEWRKEKPSFGRFHFMKYILTTGKLADVTFVVKGGEDDQSTDEIIQAHKCVLKHKSEFFSSLFSERWSSDSVDLTKSGVTSIDFKTFLEYLYLGKAPITMENAMALLDLGHMYQIDELVHDCEQFLEENIDVENALPVVNAVFLYDTRKKSALLNALVKFICENGERMLENPEMMKLKQNHLHWIFTRAEFKSAPIKLLRFCLKWTARNLGIEKLHHFKALDDLFYYDLGLERYFPSFPRIRSLLTFKEKWNMQGCRQPDKPDTVYTVSRFEGVETMKKWIYRRHRADRISFRCTESIMLTGIGLYGDRSIPPENSYGKRFCQEHSEAEVPAKYDVEVKIHLHGKSHHELLSLLRCGGGVKMNRYTHIYVIDLPPLYLQGDVWYTISVKISGPPSYFGRDGEMGTLIRCGNLPVIFEFQEASCTDEAAKLSNPTGVPIGQIPELFFKLATENNDESDVEVLEVGDL